jgi:actin-related protein
VIFSKNLQERHEMCLSFLSKIFRQNILKEYTKDVHLNYFNFNSGYRVPLKIKEKLCYIVPNFEAAIKVKANQNKPFELPNGKTIKVNDSLLFQAPEALFQPSIMELKESEGVHEMIINSVAKCDSALQEELLRNVIISGGTTKIPGFKNRLQTELDRLASSKSDNIKKVNIHCSSSIDPSYDAWNGGAVLGSLSEFKEFVFSKEEYQECGKQHVNFKCL